jgi:hypothetical protein
VTADGYVREVEFALRDLPWSQRCDLVADLRHHLAELPVETDLVARLGTPERYASDLRTAEGLARRRGPVAYLRARRRRNVVLTVIALTLVGLAIGCAVWIDSYQPLAFGNSWRFPNGSVEAPAGGSSSVVFHEGQPFELGFEIQNSGRFTARVLGVPLGAFLYPFKTRLFMYQPNFIGGDAGPLERFHPFDLKPGERDTLVLKGVYARCADWQGPGSMGMDRVPVRYSFLWRTPTASIPLPEVLAIVFKHKDNCGPPKR